MSPLRKNKRVALCFSNCFTRVLVHFVSCRLRVSGQRQEQIQHCNGILHTVIWGHPKTNDQTILKHLTHAFTENSGWSSVCHRQSASNHARDVPVYFGKQMLHGSSRSMHITTIVVVDILVLLLFLGPFCFEICSVAVRVDQTHRAVKQVWQSVKLWHSGFNCILGCFCGFRCCPINTLEPGRHGCANGHVCATLRMLEKESHMAVCMTLAVALALAPATWTAILVGVSSYLLRLMIRTRRCVPCLWHS